MGDHGRVHGLVQDHTRLGGGLTHGVEANPRSSPGGTLHG